VAKITFKADFEAHEEPKPHQIKDLSRSDAYCPAGSDVAVALYAKLGQRAGQGGVDRGNLFIGDLLLETGSGALAGFLHFGFIYSVGGDGHIRDDGDILARY
jgi:hypothetical protein